MDQCEECQRLETPTMQPRRRLFSLAWRSRSTTENQGPQKFEARAWTGAAEQGEVTARQRLAEDQQQPASVRVRVLLDRQKSRNYGASLGLRSLQASQ